MTTPRRFLGRGLPYVDVSGLSGRLFVIEGTDGVGRTTQVERLKDCLENIHDEAKYSGQ